MNGFSPSKPNSRLGFHYYPDDQHYREGDLAKWLPELKALRVGWLVLNAPTQVAIPESFLRRLVGVGIQPILHFKAPIEKSDIAENLDLLFASYAKWGVQYVVLFDRPNCRSSWPASTWAQSDLVERFLDIYIPCAMQAINHRLKPIFPPLEPGGDYWDTAFLRDSLSGIQRRGCQKLIEAMGLSAYAYTTDKDHPINWGEGGPERWPSTRPYYTPTDHEDQRGFHIYEWYLATAQAVLGHPLPIMLFGIGDRTSRAGYSSVQRIDEAEYLKRMLTIAEICIHKENLPEKNVKTTSGEIKALPAMVLSGNFWLLTEATVGTEASEKWLEMSQSNQQVIEAILSWTKDKPSEIEKANLPPTGSKERVIQHYLLLPLYEWGVSEWHLDVIRPYVMKYHPTVGFSLEEASQAVRVTIIGGNQTFPEEEIERLHKAGCTIERISGDGTSIATQMACL